MKKESSARRATTEWIYEALVELMRETPYDRITVTDIAKKAGVSRMAYYRNYRDKDDILLQRLKWVLDDAEAKIQGRTEREYWLGFIRGSAQDPIFEHLLRAEALGKVLPMCLDFVARCYRSAFGFDMTGEGEILTTYLKVGALFGALAYRQNRPKKLTDEALADYLAALMAPATVAPRAKKS